MMIWSSEWGSSPMLALTVLALVLLPGSAPLSIDDEEEPADESPRVVMALPLGVAGGCEAEVRLRGLRLGEVEAVRIDGEDGGGVTVALVEAGAAEVPGGLDAKAVGDSQVVLRLTVPEGFEGDRIGLVVESPAGSSEPYPLRINDPGEHRDEREPNDGFDGAQVIEGGGRAVVEGRIDRPRDVDVFLLEGGPGDRFRIEVEASRLGSAADLMLTVFDAEGRPIAFADDDPEGDRDPTLDLDLPADGSALIVVSEALDRGGAAFPYRLVIRPLDSGSGSALEPGAPAP